MSTTGYVFNLADATVSWRSKNQSLVALSTTKTQYVALSMAARKNIWLRSIAGDLRLFASGIMQLGEGNQTALQMAKEAPLTETSKHTTVYYHFLRETIDLVRLFYN